MTLHEAVNAMAVRATDDLVGLVVRWNKDDSTIKTIWSESSGSQAHDHNPKANERPNMVRYLDDNNPGRGFRTASPEMDPAGYHAEELLIACWPQLAPTGAITHVDLVLSKSPCCGKRGSSPLILPSESNTRFYDVGCAEKLYGFVGGLPKQTKWNIFYIALAGAAAGDYRNVGYGGIRGHMTREELELDMWRGLLIWYRDNIEAGMRNVAGEWNAMANENDLVLEKLKSDMKLHPEKKGEYGKKIGELVAVVKKERRKSDDLIREVESKLRSFDTNARRESLYIAQTGIHRLQSLVNVDVGRWIFDD